MAAKDVENGGFLLKAFRKRERRPPEEPKNPIDVVLLLAEAIRFGYSQALAKWRPFDVSLAIIYAITEKDKKTVAIECGERSDCNLLKGPELLKELYELKKLLIHTKFFSKKRFEAFLFAAGFGKEDVLLRKRSARILKPAFTVLRDKESKCLLVFIRGTRGIKDALTDAIAAPVSFSHTHIICSDGEVERNEVISGYAHRGMVAAASWIKKRCIPILLDALRDYPDFKIKVVGHSLGGGTAALLTYMLREIKQFSTSTCVTFGPAASTSLELAEFGRPFIISIINGCDIVPTLSASSVRGFIEEGRIKHKNFKNAVHSRTAIGSRLPFVSTAIAVADHALTHGTKVLLTWSQREIIASSSSKPDESTSDEDESNSSIEGPDNDDPDEEEQIIYADHSISDEELLNQLEELELGKRDPTNIHVREKEAATTEDITEESSDTFPPPTKSKQLDIHPLYPPGRIMHIVTSSEDSNSNYQDDTDQKPVYLYETATQLYGKLRLSRTMIFDHLSNKYLKMLNKVINQLQEEQTIIMKQKLAKEKMLGIDLLMEPQNLNWTS